MIPKGITEYLYHVGNTNEMNSLVGNGLAPGGMSFKRGRQAVFFTTVNPMEDFFAGRKSLRSQETKDRVIQKIGHAFEIRYFGAV